MHGIYPPIYHGHLSSHNVFVEFDKINGVQVYIADLEVNSFLKYASLLGDYQISSVWSAPEVLKANKIVEPTREMDIYSFGIMLW